MPFAETHGYEGLVQKRQRNNEGREGRTAAVGCGVIQRPGTAAKETTFDTILSTMERGFAAVATDIGEIEGEIIEIKLDITEIKSTMAAKGDVSSMNAHPSTPNSDRSVMSRPVGNYLIVDEVGKPEGTHSGAFFLYDSS
jgi:hypothetical protein